MWSQVDSAVRRCVVDMRRTAIHGISDLQCYYIHGDLIVKVPPSSPTANAPTLLCLHQSPCSERHASGRCAPRGFPTQMDVVLDENLTLREAHLLARSIRDAIIAQCPVVRLPTTLKGIKRTSLAHLNLPPCCACLESCCREPRRVWVGRAHAEFGGAHLSGRWPTWTSTWSFGRWMRVAIKFCILTQRQQMDVLRLQYDHHPHLETKESVFSEYRLPC